MDWPGSWWSDILRRKPVLIVTVFAALIFILFPTRRYYWDGVLFALDIESASGLGWSVLLLPNHLLYNALGFVFYWPLHQLIPSVRSLPVLQGLNIAASLAAVAVLGRLLHRSFRNWQLTAGLSAIFAFGATWWKYSVDADAYILAALLLLLAADSLLRGGRRMLGSTAAWHTAAMCIHQLGLFFLPAVWTAIWMDDSLSRQTRLRRCALYTAATGFATGAIYYLGYLLSGSRSTYGSFRAWIASHSADSAFNFQPAYVAAGTAKSFVQLLFGGRWRLFVEYRQPWTIILLAVMVGVLGLLVYRCWRFRGDWATFNGRLWQRAWTLSSFRVALVWAASYTLFLLVWLPRNTFYKLLFWPALILLAGSCLSLLPSPPRGRTLLFAVFLLLWNFLFLMGPYSHKSANPTLEFGEFLNTRLAGGAAVYFRDFEPDNWTIRYATPLSSWRSLQCRQAECLTLLNSELEKGDVWLDPTATRYLESASPETQAWLRERRSDGTAVECCGTRWSNRFMQVKRRKP